MPDVRVWETAYVPATPQSESFWTCGEYKVTDPRQMKFTPVKDHPLSQCAGVFGFKNEDFPTILDYIEELETYYKNKLKECKK
ncbi:MAG: hypothetical protein J7501_09115 [Bdellovibrio sp.]|nr:hypothetical protein [Bdellovibrio sp.]